MKTLDIISMCVRNLWKRKLRTFLTMIGVITATAALVLTVSLGLASDARFEQVMQNMGPEMTSINVQASGVTMWTQDGPVTPEGSRALDDDAVNDFQALPHVVMASPQQRSNMFIRSGQYQMQVSVLGLRAEAIETLYPLHAGRYLEPGEQNAALFGFNAETNFFRPTPQDEWGSNTRASQLRWGGATEVETYVDVMNEPMLFSTDWRFMWGGQMEEEDFNDMPAPVQAFELTVVGILEEGGTWQDPDFDVVMEIETLRNLEFLRLESEREQEEAAGRFSAVEREPSMSYWDVSVRVDEPANTAAVAEAINEMGFQAWYSGSWIEQMQDLQRTIQNLLVGIAAVSIFVAAISIANTMVMSVYERRREIGIMKVIGGAVGDIRWLFLFEAAIIGFLGGLFGVGLSLGVSHFLNTAGVGILGDTMGGMEWLTGDLEVVTSLITPWLCGVALAFATLIGLVSGYFPARRATRISALDAIRTD